MKNGTNKDNAPRAETNNQDLTTVLDEIMPRSEFIMKYSDKFSATQLIWLLRERKRNGLSKAGAVKKIGKMLYIHVPSFAAWIDSQSA
jgi:hypothetical protein